MIADIAPGWATAPPAPDTTFGDALRQARSARRVSQNRLADRAGFDHSYVSRLESGERWPSRDAIDAIAAALELTRSQHDTLLLAGGFAPSWATRRTIQDVVAERCRQTARWGVQDHSLPEWVSILTEEVGEAAQAANHAHWDGAGMAHLREELIQVAAVAVQIVEAIDGQAQEREAA